MHRRTCIDMVNFMGYKLWWVMNASTQHTQTLATHIRAVALIEQQNAPGIAALQHHRVVSSRDGSTTSISVYPPDLPEELSKQFVSVTQTEGDIVYTDTRFHSGSGTMCINSAWNHLKSSLCVRGWAAVDGPGGHRMEYVGGTQLGACSPVDFLSEVAELARQDLQDSTGPHADNSATFDPTSSRYVEVMVNMTYHNAHLHLGEAVQHEGVHCLQNRVRQLEGLQREKVLEAQRLGLASSSWVPSNSPMDAKLVKKLLPISYMCTRCGEPVWSELGFIPQSTISGRSAVWLCAHCVCLKGIDGFITVHTSDLKKAVVM